MSWSSIYGENTLVGSSANSTIIPVHIAKWLADTPVYVDAAEIIAEKARRYWWGQQIDLGLISWTMLLATEGRRRNIPMLWSYLALAHLVNLSLAQNLFYVAMIMTPVPLPNETDPGLPMSRYVD